MKQITDIDGKLVWGCIMTAAAISLVFIIILIVAAAAKWAINYLF